MGRAGSSRTACCAVSLGPLGQINSQIQVTKTAAMTSQPTSAANFQPPRTPMTTAATTPTSPAPPTCVVVEVNAGCEGAAGSALRAITPMVAPLAALDCA